MSALWDAAMHCPSADDVLDVKSSAAISLHLLDPFIGWVLGAPVSDIPSESLRVLLLRVWEVFIASLRIPQTQAKFEALCLDPPALREAAGLTPTPLEVLPAIEVAQRRPHPRCDQRRVRH